MRRGTPIELVAAIGFGSLLFFLLLMVCFFRFVEPEMPTERRTKPDCEYTVKP